MTCRRRSSWAAAGSLRMSTCLMLGELARSAPFQDKEGRINKLHPSVRPKPTSFRPDLPLGRAPRASAVQEAAQRPRRPAPARSVLDGASTVLGSSGREGFVHPVEDIAFGCPPGIDGR